MKIKTNFSFFLSKKDSEVENKEIEDSAMRYPSAELLLSTIQKEYDYENNRKSTLQTRAGILLSLTAAIATFGVTNINLVTLNMGNGTQLDLALFMFFVAFLALFSATLINSVFFLLWVLLADEYKRMELDGFSKEQGCYEKDVVAMALTEEYSSIIQNNQEVNNKRAKRYRIGIYSEVITIISLVILFGISKF